VRSRSRPRVLFVGNTTYQLPLSSGLARKWDSLAERMELRVVAEAAPGPQASDPRFRLVRLSDRAFAGAFHVALAPVVASEIRRFRPEVVIVQSPYEALPVLATRFAVRHSPRLVVEIHGDWRSATRLYGSRLRRAFAGVADPAALFALRRADATRALGNFTAALATSATGRPPVAIFPTYTDLESFVVEPRRPLPETPAVAWVGVLQRVKNPEVLARAWPLVSERVPEARLAVVGDGPLRPVIEALRRQFPERVETIPCLSPREVAQLLDRSTALVLPSWTEGFGRVAIEAFTRGRPVVGSAVGGIPDIVQPERNGLLVPPGDEQRLADALVRVLADRPLAERLGEAAARAAHRFQWPTERYANAVRDLVQQALLLP
jgi:glycosyltransferase involved in cell wall biosynthesis